MTQELERVSARALIRAKHVNQFVDALERIDPGEDGTDGKLIGWVGAPGRPEWVNPPAGGGLTHVNLADELDALSSDHSAALRTLIDTNGPGYTYLIPAGMEVTLPLQLLADMPQLRHKVKIVGEGPQSIINVTGFGSNPGTNYAAIGIDFNEQIGDVEDTGIENLTILGDGPGESQTWTNRQAAAVRFNSFGPLILRPTFRNVIFKNLDGFAIHSDGQDERHMLVERCSFINNGNGLNPNGHFLRALNNYFTNAEGIEACGAGVTLANNVFEDIFGFAMSIGGTFRTGVNATAIPGSRVIYNQIFGVRGGGSYGSGNGIGTQESTPDWLIGFNYIERTYGVGIVTTHGASYGPDDGGTVIGNHLVNVTGEGNASRIAIQNYASNTRYVANRVYNRAGLVGDVWPITGYGAQRGFSGFNCDNVMLDANSFDMSVKPSDLASGSYAATFNAVTNIRFGINRFLSYSTNPPIEFSNGSTTADALGLNRETLNTTGNVFSSLGYRYINVTTATTRTVNLQAAAGSKGAEVIVTAITGAAFSVIIDPNGSETIDGAAVTKTLSSNYAQMHLVSDGTGWIILNQKGTIT